MTKEDAIYEMLSKSELSKEVGNRIYPLAAEEGTQFPFVVYSQYSGAQPGTKDGSERQLTVAVSVVSKKYKEAHTLTELVMPAALKARTLTVLAGMYDPEFLAESEQFDVTTGAFAVKTEITYDYMK